MFDAKIPKYEKEKIDSDMHFNDTKVMKVGFQCCFTQKGLLKYSPHLAIPGVDFMKLIVT